MSSVERERERRKQLHGNTEKTGSRLAFLILTATLILGVGFTAVPTVEANSARYHDAVIWDPNGNRGAFTDLPVAFEGLLSQVGASATMTVTGGGGSLKSAVEGVLTRHNGWAINEIQDSTIYSGNIHINNVEKLIIRAKEDKTR